MAHIVDERVQETTTSLGSGALVLAGASPGFTSFSAAGFANGDTFWGLIEHATAVERELAFCTYSAGSITRATPKKSTTGSAVSFSTGVKTISVVAVAGSMNRSQRTIASGSSYAMTANDCVILVNKTVGGATAITLKASPKPNDEIFVMDAKGDAATNNITITPAAGTINGAANVVVSAAWQCLRLVYSGTEWNVLSWA